MPARLELRRCLLVTALSLAAMACGEHGLTLSTVDPGPDFEVARVVFDEGYFYCRVEPMLFAQGCGAGDPSRGESGGGCHYSVTTFHLTEYAPLTAESCGGGVVPQGSAPLAAQQNYQSSQSRMRRDPDAAPLLLRATGAAAHPRTIFPSQSPEADVIRQWATQYSTQ